MTKSIYNKISKYFLTYFCYMITNDHLKDISERIEKLKIYLDIDRKLVEISNDEEYTANPNFWSKPKDAEAFMKVIRSKKKMGRRI